MQAVGGLEPPPPPPPPASVPEDEALDCNPQLAINFAAAIRVNVPTAACVRPFNLQRSLVSSEPPNRFSSLFIIFGQPPFGASKRQSRTYNTFFATLVVHESLLEIEFSVAHTVNLNWCLVIYIYTAKSMV
jgi:hypothetical protein